MAKMHFIEAAIDGGGGHVDGGEDEDSPVRFGRGSRMNDLAPACADGAGAVEEEGEVATELGGEIAEAVWGPIEVE